MKFLQSSSLILLFVNLSWKSRVLSFSISSSSSDIGETYTFPARSGLNAPPINLECQLAFNQGEKWTRCTWVHSFEDVWAYDNREAFVMCSAVHESDDRQVCEDQGNLVDDIYNGGYNDPTQNPYTQYDSSRLQYLVSENSCGLTIQSPHANDTGVWKCHVNDNNPEGQSTTMWAQIDLFVANQSMVTITDPDLFNNPGTSIEVDLSSSTVVEVDAECTAQYGVPPPDIVWYIDEPSNTVDGSADQNIQSDGSVVSSIRMSLDQNSMSRYGIRMTNSYFSFALGCYPDQGDYFESREDNYKNPAEVLVFGTSSAMAVTTPVVIVLVISLFLSQL
eukprot:GFUD01032509.1.p1 GENE.GFUD01032509.1~~GFUD01032509.1.p1  ORF type:complete len:334 (+),score=61.92 GFUD01032509.1:30-1031(+)